MPKNYKTNDERSFGGEASPPPKHRKNNPNDNNLTQEVIVHLDHYFGSKILTNFHKTIPKFIINSTIVNNNIAISNELIYHTNNNNSKSSNQPVGAPQLLYRGTRDGFQGINFHSRCDNQGPTLTIIKSEHNQIFGGFTTASWKSSISGEYITDDLAFIFKIESNDSGNSIFTKFNIKQDKQKTAIYAHKNCLTVFGGGFDICISSECNLNNFSYSNFGRTYQLPPNGNGLEVESDQAQNYLAGSRKFKVSEIEVFKIIQI